MGQGAAFTIKNRHQKNATLLLSTGSTQSLEAAFSRAHPGDHPEILWPTQDLSEPLGWGAAPVAGGGAAPAAVGGGAPVADGGAGVSGHDDEEEG